MPTCSPVEVARGFPNAPQRASMSAASGNVSPRELAAEAGKGGGGGGSVRTSARSFGEPRNGSETGKESARSSLLMTGPVQGALERGWSVAWGGASGSPEASRGNCVGSGATTTTSRSCEEKRWITMREKMMRWRAGAAERTLIISIPGGSGASSGLSWATWGCSRTSPRGRSCLRGSEIIALPCWRLVPAPSWSHTVPMLIMCSSSWMVSGVFHGSLVRLS